MLQQFEKYEVVIQHAQDDTNKKNRNITLYLKPLTKSKSTVIQIFEISNYKEQLKGLVLGAKQSRQTRKQGICHCHAFQFPQLLFCS